MDSLGRRSGRQMARMRRQRSQEWRERDFSSSDNDDDPDKAAYRYALDERVAQYEKEVKAGLDARGMTKVPPAMASIPLDVGRVPRPGLPMGGGASNIQTVENRTYAPLSGSDGDTETDNGPHSPIQMLLHQQSPHLNLKPTTLGRMTLPLQRDQTSTSSSDNNSDITFPDSELIGMRANAMGSDRNVLTDSPPEPAPPEVPPRGISMHHSDLASVRTPRDVHNLSNVGRAIYSVGSSGPTSITQSQHQEKDTNHDHNSKPSQDGRANQQQQQQTVVQNNSSHHHHPHHHHHPSLLPAIMPVHTVRNNTAASLIPGASSHLPIKSAGQSQQHCNVPPSLQVSSSHFSATNFQIRKSCSHRCSWKCLAIFLVFVTVLLTAALAYFGAVSTMPFHLESSIGCIPVGDAQLASMEGVENTPHPTVKVPTLYPTRVAPNDHDLWPVMEISFNNKTSRKILPHGFWNFQIQQKRGSLVRFNVSLAESADGALYGRRHQPPTITRHDFVVKIEKHALSKRHVRASLMTSSPQEVSFVHQLDPGWWFFSLYNDGGEPQAVTFVAEIIADEAEPCLNNCNNHGACTQGKCECYKGYTGNACELRLCPVLCSNHGSYSGGVCHCERGWKGAECGVPELDCEVPDCNSNGECRAGFCVCNPGFKGRHCDQVDCLDPLCSDHGICAAGRCICRPGWNGQNCGKVDDRLVRCLPNCSGHGTFDLDVGKCVCEKYWTGPDCSEAFCNADCGAYGKCIGEHCHCVAGWTGAKCDLKLCDARCSVHGQCNNGTCVCMQGWNGRHCTLEGCTKDCNHHGDCLTSESGEYQCHCHDGWDGLDCAVQLEKVCDDLLDNDEDGVVDCADSECCLLDVCRESIMCVTTADPVDVLNRKQPPAVTASFYQRMKFLIEEKSVQNYVHKDEYSENKFWSSFIKSRVSVIRGRVVNKLGQGIVGTRVSVDTEPNFGFALSRDQGWFDIMVNGGGAVTLRFHRSPFLSTIKKIMVPWNQIVVMDTDAIMVTSEDQLPAEPSSARPECVQHDHAYTKPTIHETWQPGMLGGCPDRRVIYMETQVVQESLEIPGSHLHLLYQSSSSPGYHGSLHVQLTPERVPPSLTIVHLRVVIEGVLVQRRFEADPNVTFTFSWNKRNVYKQKVYGVATAIVSVGYQYSTCEDIVWATQTATLQGYDMDISEIGGWNLDIHHRYNFQDGILQKGDGTTVYFARQPNIVQVVMGNGEQRPQSCEDCNGSAKDAKILAPVALTSAPDGSVYVGDFNLVRRINRMGNVHTILKLSATQMFYHYHLAVHPVDGSLYMSSPEKGEIVRVITAEDEDEEKVKVVNVETVVGNGERCIVGDHNACGDGGLGIEARLAFPKGMTISSEGELYFADGTNIRAVDKRGIIRTIIGSHHHHRRLRKPLPCKRAILASEVQLLWPTEVALSPLDGALYFIDDNMIMKLTKDRQVYVVTGHPLHCEGSGHEERETAKGSSFGAILNIAFAPNGNLLFVEVTAEKVNYVHAVTPDGKLEHFAGTAPLCDCAVQLNCTCANNPKYSLAINTRLFAVSALTITPDGAVYVVDRGSLRVLSMSRYLPKANQLGEYEITFPDTQEIYTFNRHGQHTSTKNIQTGKAVYYFLYSVNTSFGKLSTVTDAASNKISFLRDYSGKITTIENAQGQEYSIKISKMGLMEGLRTFSNFEIAFEYQGGGGLLSSRTDSAENTYIYGYDDNGRLSEAVTPTGQTVGLTSGMYPVGAVVTIMRGNSKPSSLIMAKSSVITLGEDSVIELKAFPNGTSELITPWGYRSEMYSEPHVGLELTNPIQSEMFFTPIGWQATSGHLSTLVRWKYGILGDIRAPERLLERQLWVNNISVLTVEYDQTMLREVIYDKDHYSVIAIQYNSAGKPIQWVPSIGGLPVNIMYDRFGRLSSWQWGKMGEEYTYDQRGLLTEIKYEDNTSLHYGYAENSMPIKFTLSSKREFQFHYDHRGGLKHITMPSGSQHHFSVQLSMGFTKLLYSPPGFKSPLVQHYDDDGLLLMEIQPEGMGRILYRYGSNRRPQAVVYGNTSILFAYDDGSDLVAEIHQKSGEFEYRKEYKYRGILVTEERHKFGTHTALSNAKFVYEYDNNFRLISFKGRIGGQDIPAVNYTYDSRTGLPKSIGQFEVSSPRPNETSVHDGVATFNRSRDTHFRDVRVKLTIDKSEVYKMDVGYDERNRIARVRTQLRKMGLVANSDTKNYTYDADGQLREVHAHDTWKFEYDVNGNMVSLNFRGHVISLQYDDMDRIVKFSEMSCKVDARGFITQRGEEHFYYDARGRMVRATQLNRYDVWYYYDEADRLVARKDHFGNITQFFYVNPDARFQVTHIFSPRDGRIMALMYDDRHHLIYARVGAHRYYVGTDLGGTPLVIFNGYGEVVREMLRSPYGHIVYDSNPFIYMPIDYRGGILDSVTGFIHLHDRVYDPLIGHWMTPEWKDVSRLFVPHAFHFFRINGNDPVNPRTDKWFLTDHQSWLRRLGYDAGSLLPHLNPRMHHNCLPLHAKAVPILAQESLEAVSGVSCIVSIREATLLQLSTVPRTLVKKEPVVHHYVPRLHVASAPLGEGIVVSLADKKAVVRAANEANSILRDVMTSVLNQSHFLDARLSHHGHHDVFFFAKENVWQVTADCNQLQRLGSSLVNFTVHKPDAEAGAKDAAQFVDVKIRTHGAVLNVRYGSTYGQERTRVLRMAKKHAAQEAWAAEKRRLAAGYSGWRDWSPPEIEQILQTGSAQGYRLEYIHPVDEYVELADDPNNLAFERVPAPAGHRR